MISMFTHSQPPKRIEVHAPHQEYKPPAGCTTRPKSGFDVTNLSLVPRPGMNPLDPKAVAADGIIIILQFIFI